ncbi:TetR/AcrR family transcriptional regulator [Trinickia terrae]|uniref:TetR/AcrR family transcriptional regulator n=1 Tax=Trinickia terrae TaxID=2571161 RepID=A0A4U1I111_9BURK|nr:TetR/AcrR family transcriptional regulator [Trinickia terrae]TKC86834.1 TetR/AcrR family transcriptional regulator [Trinickia terrae]
MKVSREQFLENRERILEVASQMFREKGFDGVGVADIMNGAGMTHGGFYRHFASKEDLAAKASEAAMASTAQAWSRIRENQPGNALATFVGQYLSERHRDSPGKGCMLASLASDAARQGPEIRKSFAGGIASTFTSIEQMLPGEPGAENRRAAIALMAELVGAMVMARAVGDEAQSKEILDAVAADLQAVCESR